MSISARIFELLKAQGKTQTSLANYIGIRVATVSAWKAQNTDPSANLLAKIAEFFGVSVDYLVTGKEQEKKPAASDEPSIKIKNVKFIGRDGKVKYKNLSPEMIAMLEQLPDSDEDL